MPQIASYAEDCLAALNGEVPRQTIVIRTEDMSVADAVRVIDYIVERLPEKNLRLKVIRCSPGNAHAIVTDGDPLSGGRRGAAPVLVMENASEVIELVVAPVRKPSGSRIDCCGSRVPDIAMQLDERISGVERAP